jgi:hypothetical protein
VQLFDLAPAGAVRGRWPAEDGEGGGWSAGPGGSQAAALTSRNLARLGLGFVPGQRYVGSTLWIRKRRMRGGRGGGLRREESPEPAGIDRRRRRRQRESGGLGVGGSGVGRHAWEKTRGQILANFGLMKRENVAPSFS